MTERKLKIILDPGHGELAGGGLPADPGAVGNGTTEAAQNIAVALTLKAALIAAGHNVTLTRTDAHRVSWYARGAGAGEADLYLSIHHDTVNGRSMAYYAAGSDYSGGPRLDKSAAFAKLIQRAVPDPEFTVLPDSASRFGRLYIRGALAPVSVLWEIDPVHIETLEQRQARAAELLSAVNAGIAGGVL